MELLLNIQCVQTISNWKTPFSFSYVGAIKAPIFLYRDKTVLWGGKEYKKKSFSGGRYNKGPCR
jgi:hypothetical protein